MNKKNEVLSYEEVEKRFKEKGLKLLTKEYKNNHQLLDCEDEYGYRYNPTINTLNGLNLTKLVYTWNKWSIYNIKKYIENNHISTILLSKEYKGSKTPMTFKCECGEIFYCYWSDFQTRNRYYCHKCALKYGTKRLKQDFIKKEFEKHGLTIMNDEVYKNNRTPLKCLTNDGHIILKNYSNLVDGYFDYSKKEKHISKGEQKIAGILDDLDVVFIRQYTFKDCKKQNKLLFDFYLPDYNICIEYNGEQHYKPIKYFGGEEKLKRQKENDKIKENYCINNDIKLIIIPYTEFKNIRSILINNLSLKE